MLGVDDFALKRRHRYAMILTDADPGERVDVLPEQRVGRPPVRGAVRLERVELPGVGMLVHNCGHGGAGVTVVWRCAREAARLVLGGRAASV
ncbi:hypothetical protein [Streptomyces sp. NPDC004721]